MHRKATWRLGGAATTGFACVLSVGAAHAQNRVILDQPFNGTDGIPYSYAYQSNGTVSTSAGDTSSYFDFNGPGGSRAEFIRADSTGVENATGQTFRYWGMGLGNFMPAGANQPTALNQSDYLWSADVRAAGTEVNGAQARFRVQFQTDTNGDGVGEPLVDLRSPNFTLANGLAHFSSNLASWVPEDANAGTWAAFQNAVQSGQRIIGASVFLSMDDGGNGFGYDSGNEMGYDNLRLEQIVPVPEPAALSVLGAAGLIALGGRRRRS